jgi:hypothetical protein
MGFVVCYINLHLLFNKFSGKNEREKEKEREIQREINSKRERDEKER